MMIRWLLPILFAVPALAEEEQYVKIKLADLQAIYAELSNPVPRCQSLRPLLEALERAQTAQVIEEEKGDDESD